MVNILFFATITLLSVGIDGVLGYWLMGAILGGSNFGLNLSTARLRQSECSSIPIPEDKSNYWYPKLYFWWRNGSFTSVVGNPVM
ncbi:hypothetical protein MD484_g6915, partial [Candolleomyces efflorescens]